MTQLNGNRISRRALLGAGAVAGLGVLGLSENALAATTQLHPSLPFSASAVQRETWSVTGNGFTGELIFRGIGSYQGGSILPGSIYIGTAYGQPMLSHFVNKGSGLYDMGFVRIQPDFKLSYFQLWYGTWNSNNQTMKGQFYGISRKNFIQFSVDGPYNWNAKLLHGGSYDTYDDHLLFYRFSHTKRGENPFYHDMSWLGYQDAGPTTTLLQGYIRDLRYPLIGYLAESSSIHGLIHHNFLAPTSGNFRLFGVYTGTQSVKNPSNLDGDVAFTQFDPDARTFTLQNGSTLGNWHTIEK